MSLSPPLRPHTTHSVNVTFIDYLGQRHPVPGRVGMTLTDVCLKHNMDLLQCDASDGGTAKEDEMTDDYTRDLYGEGAWHRAPFARTSPHKKELCVCLSAAGEPVG